MDSEGLVSGESYRISTRYTHDQLGSMIGAGRVSVSRAFSDLTQAGAVELKKRYIHIMNMDALTQASEASKAAAS